MNLFLLNDCRIYVIRVTHLFQSRIDIKICAVILCITVTERERLSRNLASSRWKRRNPELVKTAHKRWVSLNREHRKRYLDAYNAKRKESQKEYDRLRYLKPENQAKRERLKSCQKEYNRKWLKAHPEQGRLNHARRKARKLSGGIGNTKLITKWIRSWQSLIRVQCYWCRKRFSPKCCHVDHIVPLNKGGQHAIQNLCISCSGCNMKKHDKTLSIWNEQIIEPVLF